MDKVDLQSQLKLIPGVLGVNLLWGTEDDALSEVHILADQTRKAREVMLDVKSFLSVALQQPIDFRIISVAQVDSTKMSDESHEEVRPPRLVLSAAYMRRLPNNGFEGVVELRLGDEEILGKSRTASGEAVSEVISRAFVEALKDLLPNYTIRPKLQFMPGYCLTDVQLMNSMTGDNEELVGAVKLSGDQAWDVSRSILSAMNRRLETLLLCRISA